VWRVVRRIKLRSAYMMLVGTLLVCLFSDPMVGVLNGETSILHH
jgi:hypothetical protein